MCQLILYAAVYVSFYWSPTMWGTRLIKLTHTGTSYLFILFCVLFHIYCICSE